MPPIGALKASVRVATPVRCSLASCSAEMSQFLSRDSAAAAIARALSRVIASACAIPAEAERAIRYSC